jgi:class 3 adenylate cyclase
MQQALAAWNLGRAAPVNMRIGVNTGTVVRGDFGPQFRREFAVIGDTVNRANRYEAGCPPGQLLVSQTTRDALGDRVECIAMPGLILKGVDNPVIAYVVKELRP